MLCLSAQRKGGAISGGGGNGQGAVDDGLLGSLDLLEHVSGDVVAGGGEADSAVSEGVVVLAALELAGLEVLGDGNAAGAGVLQSGGDDPVVVENGSLVGVNTDTPDLSLSAGVHGAGTGTAGSMVDHVSTLGDHVLCSGVAAAQAAALNNDWTISSALKATGAGCVAIAKDIKAGNFTGGVHHYTLADGAIDFATTGDHIPADVLEKVNAAKEAITAGYLVVPTSVVDCLTFTLNK